MTGLCDHVIMVRGRGARLPRRAAAAEGRDRRGRDRRGARRRRHARDRLGSRRARRRRRRERAGHRARADRRARLAAARDVARCDRRRSLDAEDLLGLFGADTKKPVDMRHVIARIVDASDFLEFKAGYGPATVCGHAAIGGFRVGIVTNNGPLDPAGSTKVTHFVQAAASSGQPIVWLQNTTGFIVGSEAERAGMIKHGSQADPGAQRTRRCRRSPSSAARRSAPATTACAAAAFGRASSSAGRRAKTAVMGAEQAAGTMEIVMREGAARKGEAGRRGRASRPFEGEDRRHLRAPDATRSTPRACCSTTA